MSISETCDGLKAEYEELRKINLKVFPEIPEILKAVVSKKNPFKFYQGAPDDAVEFMKTIKGVIAINRHNDVEDLLLEILLVANDYLKELSQTLYVNQNAVSAPASPETKERLRLNIENRRKREKEEKEDLEKRYTDFSPHPMYISPEDLRADIKKLPTMLSINGWKKFEKKNDSLDFEHFNKRVQKRVDLLNQQTQQITEQAPNLKNNGKWRNTIDRLLDKKEDAYLAILDMAIEFYSVKKLKSEIAQECDYRVKRQKDDSEKLVEKLVVEKNSIDFDFDADGYPMINLDLFFESDKKK